MLPLRYAAILAVAILFTCLWFAARDVGYAPAPLYERLAERCEGFGLYGYAITLHLRASERYSSGDGEAGGVAAAASLERAARLLHRHAGPESAADVLLRAGELDPARTDLRVEILERRIAAGDQVAAAELFSLAFSEENPDALRAVAEEYRAAGKTADAMGCLRHAASAAPGRHAIRLALARLCRETGDLRGAKAEAVAAAGSAATSEQKAAARALLRELGEPLPTAAQDLWRDRCDTYLLPLALLVGFLLVVFSPCLLRVTRNLGTRSARGRAASPVAASSSAE